MHVRSMVALGRKYLATRAQVVRTRSVQSGSESGGRKYGGTHIENRQASSRRNSGGRTQLQSPEFCAAAKSCHACLTSDREPSAAVSRICEKHCLCCLFSMQVRFMVDSKVNRPRQSLLSRAGSRCLLVRTSLIT